MHEKSSVQNKYRNLLNGEEKIRIRNFNSNEFMKAISFTNKQYAKPYKIEAGLTEEENSLILDLQWEKKPSCHKIKAIFIIIK